MLIYLVTHSSTYDTRAEAAGAFFREKGNEVRFIFSDFDHLKREKRRSSPYPSDGDRMYLPMAPYQKNLSARRLLSIRRFAADTQKFLDDRLDAIGKSRGREYVRDQVLLWFMVPANSFARVAADLKKKYRVRIVLDLIDLWPESIPRPEIRSFPPMRAWAALRDRNLPCADKIFVECSLYRKILRLPDTEVTILPWFKQETGSLGQEARRRTPSWDDGQLRIAYLGAVNNIIDIELITRFLRILSARVHSEGKKLVLDVIGEGEHKQDFLRALREGSIAFEDHGAVYEEKEKYRILQNCRFGLNFMKPSVRVGLTMKSIDYLSFGLPVLNTIPNDTWDLVEREKAGINVERDSLEAAAETVTALARSREKWENMHRRAGETFEKYFTRQAFESVLDHAFFRRAGERHGDEEDKSPDEDTGVSGKRDY